MGEPVADLGNAGLDTGRRRASECWPMDRKTRHLRQNRCHKAWEKTTVRSGLAKPSAIWEMSAGAVVDRRVSQHSPGSPRAPQNLSLLARAPAPSAGARCIEVGEQAMGITVILFDQRAANDLSPFANDTKVSKRRVNASNSIDSIVPWIGSQASSEQIAILRTYGHGRVRDGQAFGVQFGAEDILYGTAVKFAPLKARFQPTGRIELRSCMAGLGAGATLPPELGPHYAKYLAVQSGAFVYASEDLQIGGIEQSLANTEWTSVTHFTNQNNQQMSMKSKDFIWVLSPFILEPAKRIRANQVSRSSSPNKQYSGP